MVAAAAQEGAGSLRRILKIRTLTLHEQLDELVGTDAIGDRLAYIRFLSVQYAARAPIERWTAHHGDPALIPPPTAPLIAGDLAALGAALPAEQPFIAPATSDPRGIAWAIGGSSLGNKVLLRERQRAGMDAGDSFLSDPRTAAFFRRILPALEEIVSEQEAEAAVAGAEAVFRTFLAAASRTDLRAAA